MAIYDELIKKVTELNNGLFDAENSMEYHEREFSAKRHYFAANPCFETVFDLAVQASILKEKRENVEKLRKELEEVLAAIGG